MQLWVVLQIIQRDHSDFRINTSILCLFCIYHIGIKEKANHALNNGFITKGSNNIISMT